MGRRIIESAMSGYNGTIFCYGQTSSGKTHTMYGTEENPGIVRLAAREIYTIIQSTPDREYLVCASMVEVYNENIKDLLGRKPARIREDCYGRIMLEADKKAVSTPEQILAVLRDGEKQASRATTNMNDMSSRSHTIFRLYIESKVRTADDDTNGEMALQSELNLVDLAGSECAAMTGAEGSLRREGAFINKSLLALSTVIEKLSSLADKKAASTFINFRDSTLTRMLQSSLGGNSKTTIICNVSLAPGNFSQTNSTLMFASRAKKIQNSAKINEVTDDRTELKKCKWEIGELKKQLSLHEAKLNEVALQTIINEHDEKVRDLQAEREQLARKLEACMKMISVSNQQPAIKPKPEQFNRRFTLACSSMRNFLLSPAKPVPMPFEAPDWSGRPSRVRRGEFLASGSESLEPGGGDVLEKDCDAADPLDLLEGGEKVTKKRKCSSGSHPQPCPRLDAAAQTDTAEADFTNNSISGRILELESLLQATCTQLASSQASLLDVQCSKDQLTEQASQQVDEMARQHQVEVQRLQAVIASMEEQQHTSLLNVQRSKDQLTEQEAVLVKVQEDCIALCEAHSQQTVDLQSKLAAEVEGISQLQIAVQQKESQVAELQGRLIALQQEAREGAQQLAMVRQQLAQCEGENLQVTQQLAGLQGTLEEQEAAAQSRMQELEERIAAAETTQETHQAELQWWKEQVAQRDGQLQQLQEETESLRLQHGALLREMGTVAPALTGTRKLPTEKLRDDNVAMQKQLMALKNDLLLKDRKLKAFEKGQEGRAKEMEKLQARVKAADEMLKQLRQEKGAVVQELVKKDAELKDGKRKLERVDKESEKYTATLKGERDRLRQAQEELAAVQKVLHANLLEKQLLKEADDAHRTELAGLQEVTAQQEAGLKEREERLQKLLQTEQTLNANLMEMAELHQKALLDHQAAVHRGDALTSQLQVVEGRLARQTEESKQALEEMQNRVELLQQQLNDTNELQEILSKEKYEIEAALKQEAEKVKRLCLDKVVLEQQLQERTAECEAMQVAQQHATTAMCEQQKISEGQRLTIDNMEAALAHCNCDLENLRSTCGQQQLEMEELKKVYATSAGQRSALEQKLQSTAQELTELREQHEETESELGKASTRVLELETDRDTWQMENENLREELEDTKAKLHTCLAQAEQAMEDFQRRKVEFDNQQEQLRAELLGRSNELRATQLELAEKKKAAMMLEADVQRLEAEWKADMQGYVREFAEKERHFAKILAENKFLAEEVETFQMQAQQKCRDLEEMSFKHEEASKAHTRELQSMQEQLEEASRQRRIAVGRLEKELGEAKIQAARIPGLQQELQTACQQGEETQATVDTLQLQLHGLRDALQQKDAQLTLAESHASDLKGEVEDWRLQLLQKEGELTEALALASTSASALKASQAQATEHEARAAVKDDQLAQAHAQLAAAEDLAGRREKALQSLQLETAELKRERSNAQLAMAQKEGEMEGLRSQLQRVTDQRKQLESLVAQRDTELEGVRQQHAEQVQQLGGRLNSAQAALEEARQEAAVTQQELAQAREACASLEMALNVDRRAHQRKVEQLEEIIQCAKERVTQTEHASESEKVVHRRQTMVISTTESQLRHLQAEKDQLEATLQEAQRNLQALVEQEAQATSMRQQMKEAQDELQEERTYLQDRIKIFEASLSDAGQVEKGLREKVEKLQEEMARQQSKHEKAMRKLKENAETRYQMLKEKALERLDRCRRDNTNRRSLAPVDLLGKENPLVGIEKVKIETEPLNLTEGERRVPRRTSLSRTPFAIRTNIDAPKTDDAEQEKDAMGVDDSSASLDVFASPRAVRWAIDSTQ